MLIVLGGLALLLVGSSIVNQMIVVMINTIAYILLGIFHHYRTHDLHAKIVVEYVLMGSLGMGIAFFFLYSL